MRTKKITLYYKLTPNEVVSPSLKELERKDRWVKQLQKTVESEWKPIVMKVTYEPYDHDIVKQIRFFNGTVVKYYAIQDQDMTVGYPSSELIKQYREQILDEMLGYDVALVNRTVRRRRSTTDFRSVEAWYEFLNTVQETLFDSAGYEFPSSEEFWKLVEEVGYEQAENISIKQLQTRIAKKYENK